MGTATEGGPKGEAPNIKWELRQRENQREQETRRKIGQISNGMHKKKDRRIVEEWNHIGVMTLYQSKSIMVESTPWSVK